MESDELIFIGIKGSAVALNRGTGEIVWEVHLRGTGFVHLVLDGDSLFATAQGEVFCLNPENGEGRWDNKMKGYGWGLASIATRNVPNSAVNLLAQEEAQQRDAQSGAGAGA